MSIVLLGVLAVGFGFSAQFSGISDATTEDSLQKQFRDPPREYSLMPLWAWNSTLTREKLTWQIDQMMEKGVYGAFMHARAGLDQSQTPYFSKGFWDAVKISVEHAEKTGFQTWIYDEDKWPSGSAGGRTMRANPERYTATHLEHTSRVIEGPAQTVLSFADARFVSAARLVGENQIDPATIVDLTHLKAGNPWKVPPGRWHICILLAARAASPLPNYLNPDAVREFLNNTYEQYAARFGKHFGKTIPGSFFDEILNLPLAWDPILLERFRKAKGYDLEKVLPLLWHEGDARTIKIRCDYFEVFTKLYEDSWFRQISEWCERHNLQLTGHTLETLRNIRDQGDYFRTWRHAQIPGTDNEDFRYTFPREIGAWKPKQLSSVSHLYGKKRSAVEALAGAGWSVTLDQARYGINLLAVYGINDFILTLFHYSMDQPQSMDDWPNSWFYQNPYWKYFKQLADYTRRISFMGSQGSHVADVALLYPVEEIWSRRAPENRFTEESSPVTELTGRLMREQIDCDLADTDSLIAASTAGNGRARIGRETYRVFVLPGAKTVSLAAYGRIAELAKNGLRVAVVGDPPRHSAENGADDPEVIRISNELFSGRTLKDANALIAFLRGTIPSDVEVLEGPRGAFRYLHRRLDGREIYWLVNTAQKPMRWRVRFASSGAVEKWLPADGAMTRIPVERRDAKSTTLRLEFQPWEGFFVVFHPAGAYRGNTFSPRPRPRPAHNSVPTLLELKGPWTFQMAPQELDYVWKSDPGETVVEVPVMEMGIERNSQKSTADDVRWRRIKVLDPLNPRKGVSRYFSAWDAAWITRYLYRDFPGELGGPELHFQKVLDLPFVPSNSWLAIAADDRFQCVVNGVKVSEGKGWALSFLAESLPLKQGRNVIDIVVGGAGYLLAQGEITDATGRKILLRTDKQWRVSGPRKEWLPAFEFAYPPFGAWGDIPMRGNSQETPAVVWYRAVVPPGARWMEPPAVQGHYQIFLDDKPIKFSETSLPPGGKIPLPQSFAGQNIIRLRVRVEKAEDGLQQPLVFHCGSTPAGLMDWQKLGLDWYSGRGVYRTTWELPRENAGKRLVMDLGDLRYTGEIWLNGRMVTSFAWPPYEADITKFAVPGKNELVVVAANLLANRMRWDIFDSAISVQFSRWWHDGSILREDDHLRSGLLGPVSIKIFHRKESGSMQ